MDPFINTVSKNSDFCKGSASLQQSACISSPANHQERYNQFITPSLDLCHLQQNSLCLASSTQATRAHNSQTNQSKGLWLFRHMQKKTNKSLKRSERRLPLHGAPLKSGNYAILAFTYCEHIVSALRICKQNSMSFSLAVWDLRNVGPFCNILPFFKV